MIGVSTAKDKVAALPGGAGSVLAVAANPIYLADPTKIRNVAQALATMANQAKTSNQAISRAVAELEVWQGLTASAFRDYMSSFIRSGKATHTALVASALTMSRMTQALSCGKANLEERFGQVIRDFCGMNGYALSHQLARETAARMVISTHYTAINSEITHTVGELDVATRELHSIINNFGPRFTTLRGPSGDLPQPKIALAAFSRKAPTHAGRLPSSPPETVRNWIQQAIAILEHAGVPANKLNSGDLWLIIQHESGGNPNAINRRDGNARAGHPSIGLMQCTSLTFRAHMLPGHKNIHDPVDNIIAGVRYALSRYGSLDNVPGVRALRTGKHYIGY